MDYLTQLTEANQKARDERAQLHAQNAALLAALERIANPGCGCKPVCRCNDSLAGAIITIGGMRELAADAITEATREGNTPSKTRRDDFAASLVERIAELEAQRDKMHVLQRPIINGQIGLVQAIAHDYSEATK